MFTCLDIISILSQPKVQLVYLNSSLNYKTKDDLSVIKDDFEMVCVEILSQAEKILYAVVFTDTQTLTYKNS